MKERERERECGGRKKREMENVEYSRKRKGLDLESRFLIIFKISFHVIS